MAEERGRSSKPLRATHMAENTDAPDESECLMRVRRDEHVPVEQPFWEKTNVCESGDRVQTGSQVHLERLTERFGLET